MNIISWNCRGLGSAAAVRAVKDVIRSHRPRILCLLETKRTVNSWNFLRVDLGFTNCFAVDRVGLSGGLAVLWKEDVILNIRNFSRHHIHMQVDSNGFFDLTLFYGNPVESKRRESWMLLQHLCSLVTGPWMVTGDFNEVFFGWEVSGERMRNSANMRRFRDASDSCGLIDLGFQGSSFTFTNKRLYPHEYKARLDRVLVNLSWKERFPNATVSHATATKSDHCPLITSLEGLINQSRSAIFHYESMWHRHNQFGVVMETIWNKAQQESNSLSASLKVCAQELRYWNKHHFGHVARKVANLRTQLEAIRNSRRTSAMAEKEKEVVSLMDEWQEREEWMWKQRSRIDWLKEGDRNTRFFHAKASQRTRTNRIVSLKKHCGEAIYTQSEMKQVVTNYFETVFSSEVMEEDVDWTAELRLITPKITEEMNVKLMEPVSNEEIKATLFQMNPSKAPGLDGFPALFYQKNWHLVGRDVCKEVSQFLQNGILSDEANLTRIALIPKCKGADSMANFRPISLCPVIMRLASKIITGRLQSVLPSIISDSQSAFIKGRLISDNILIAHELSHTIKSRKGKYNGLASLKLDMSKAFDRLEWVFIEKMLLRLGFAVQWVTRIMQCIRSVRYKVQINHELTDVIVPSRGIRQGDPISPYIFIICSEWLSAALRDEIQGVQLNQAAPTISHLFFADDSLIFTKANVEKVTKIKEILSRYQKLSGQRVNIQKSEIVFSPNVDAHIKTEISQILLIREVNKHTQYLGLPLSVGQSKQTTFRFVEEKCSKRVADWKTKLLSSAGKETLIKSVLQAIPQYAMSCYKLPLSTCTRLERILTHFWWSIGKGEHPIHWIRREILFDSKNNGGLSLRYPSAMNDALLLKQAWRISTEPDLLMSKLFKAKYFRSSDLFSAGLGSLPSHAWRGLCKIKNNLLKGIEFVEGENKPLWKLASCGDFTTKSAYQLLSDSCPNSPFMRGESSSQDHVQSYWKRIWKLQLPGKIKIFSWRVFHNGLPVSTNLCRRGILDCNVCTFCGWTSEDLCHLFRDCWLAKAVGAKLGLPDHIFALSGGSPADWLCWCSKEMRVENFRKLICASWSIWYSRNDVRHNGKGWSVDSIVAKVLSLIAQWDKYASKSGAYRLSPDGISPVSIFCDGSWTSPRASAGLAAILFENEVIQSLSACYMESIRSSREAEGEALLLGLNLALSVGLPCMIFYTDSMEVVKAIFERRAQTTFQPAWIAKCLELLDAHKGWNVEHCSRDRNNRADAVARYCRLNHWSWSALHALPRLDVLSSY